MEFSRDGRMLALCLKTSKETTVRVYEIKAEKKEQYLEEIKSKLLDSEWMVEFKEKGGQKVGFVNKLKFD